GPIAGLASGIGPVAVDARRGEPGAHHRVQDSRVDVAGDDGGDLRVAGIGLGRYRIGDPAGLAVFGGSAGSPGPLGGPLAFGFGCAGEVAELVQGHVELDLDGLAGDVGEAVA